MTNKKTEEAEYKERVITAFAEAKNAAEEAFKKFRNNSKKTPDGHIIDTCGRAYLEISKPSYKFKNTLKSMGLIKKSYKSTYWTIDSFDKIVTDQSITAHEKAYKAAKVVLEKYFPEEPEIRVSSYID